MAKKPVKSGGGHSRDPRPQYPHNMSLIPSRNQVTLHDFWLWVAVLYQYCWDAAWQFPAFKGKQAGAQPSGDPTVDLNLLEISYATAPYGGSAAQADVQLSALERFLKRKLPDYSNMRVRQLWLVANAVDRDPLNLSRDPGRAQVLPLLLAGVQAWSTCHSDAYGQFLQTLLGQMKPQVMLDFPGQGVDPDFPAWAQATGLVSGATLQHLWYGRVRKENATLFEVYLALCALTVGKGQSVDHYAYEAFGA